MASGPVSPINAAPERATRFLGHAIHRAVAAELRSEHGGWFEYAPSRGVDYTDALTSTRVELTTFAQKGAHEARPGHAGTEYVLYDLAQVP